MPSLRLVIAVLALSVLAACASLAPSASSTGRLQGRTYVLVGASSPLGRDVALRLGAAHANVVLAAHPTELLDGVAAEVRRAGGQALIVHADVTRPSELKRLTQAAVKRFGQIDVWLNFTGFGRLEIGRAHV